MRNAPGPSASNPVNAASDRLSSAQRLPAESERDLPLLAALKRGESDATRAIVERARPIVERTVRRLLGTRDRDQEDVVQGAMVEIALGAARFRGDCPIEAWFSRVTAYVIYKHIRRRQMERRILDRKSVV